MGFFFVKVGVTAVVVALISELAKRYSLVAAALASLPLTSILAFFWIYVEHKDPAQIAQLSYEILWLILPSALFFVVLPFLLKAGMKFYPAMGASMVLMILGYGAFILAKRWLF